MFAFLAAGFAKYSALPVRHGEEDSHDRCAQQLEQVCVEAEGQHQLDDDVVDDGTQRDRHHLEGKVVEDAAEHSLADDDSGQTDDDGAAAHADIRKALILAQQSAGQRHQTVGDGQTQHDVEVGVDALCAGHGGVGAGGADGAAQLGAEEPVQHAR